MVVSLIPEAPKGGVSLVPEVKVQLDDEVIRSRIGKADYAMGAESPGQGALAADFWSGFERRVREQAALSEATRMRTEWMQASSDIAKAAAMEGRPLNDLEMSYILDRPVEEVSANSALEKKFARRVVEESAPEMDDDAKGYTMNVVARQQLAQRVLEDVTQRYNESSWGSWAVDFAKGLIPFYTWSNMVGALEGLEGSSFLPGSNVAEQIQRLYLESKNEEEFYDRLKTAVDRIAESNLIDAKQFAQAAVAFSTSDVIFDNLFGAMDVADVATLGGSAALKIGTGALRARKAAKDIARMTADPKATSVDRKVVQGDVEGAAVDGVKDRLDEGKLAGPANPPLAGGQDAFVNDPTKTGFGMADPEVYLRNAGSLSNEAQRRLLESLTDNHRLLQQTFGNHDVAGSVTHIVRTDDAAFQAGVKAAQKEFLRTNYRLEDAIVEVRPVREQTEVFGGVDRVEFLIGTKDATAFKTPSKATFTAEKMYKLPKGSYEIEQVGNGYFLKMDRHVREDSLEVLDIRLNTDNQAPVNWKNRWIGWLRNPDDIRAADASAVAKQATYGANAVMNRMAEVAKSIGALGKNELDRLSTIMDEAKFKKRTVVDPQTNQPVTVSGVFYDTVADLEKAYLKRGFSLPTTKEAEAYFSFRQLMDYDHAVRNVSVYRDKARLGINQKSIGWISKDETGKKTYTHSPFFEGRVIDSLPTRSSEPFTIGWYNGETGKVRFETSDTLRYGREWDEINDLIGKDYKIIQVADPKEPALRDLVKSGGEPVQYLIVRDVKEKPLSMNQVPYNEGGHWMYPQMGYYLKQAKTHGTARNRRVYDGDVTAHYFRSTAEAKGFQEAYETARQMLLRNDPGLDAFAASRLPYTGDEFRKLFKSQDNPDGAFDINSPFVTTESGQRVSDVLRLEDIFPEKLVDPSRSEHSVLGKINAEYAQERGERLTSVKNIGTEANPVYKLTGAPVMDTLESLGRSSAQLAKTRFFDDLKHRNVENWATQFADVIDAPKQTVMADPMRFIRDPEWRKGADAAKLAAAQQNRRALLYLLGQDTTDSGAVKWMRQKIVDGVLKAHGKDSKLLDSWKWGKDADPGTVARSAVFDMKLGLFNVVQFPLQGQAVLHVAAIDGNPIRAAQANFLYWSMRMRGLASGNRKAQSFFGKAMSKALGVDQKLVDEMYDAFSKSGMDVMEGEYARLDDYLSPTQVYGKGLIDKGRDKARFFFKEGNMWHRGTAFATSFLRWRAENPTKMLNAAEMQKIVDRADLYYINMSRASNNDILAGSVPSIPAQFMTFHKNVSEQLLGSRLTPAEKARVMLMYSTVYGLPVGVGLPAAPIWPIHEEIRQAVLEQGIDTDSNAIVKFLMQGAGGMAIEMLTGDGYNFGERYGPGGLTWLRDLIDGEVGEVVGGASGSGLAEAFKRMEPFVWWTVSVFNPMADDTYPLTKDDFLDAAREISSINNLARAYYAVNVGQYMTKSDRPVLNMDADMADGIAMALGLTPQAAADTYLMIRSDEQHKQVKAELGREVVKWFNRGMKASADGDEKQAKAFYKRAHHIMMGAGMTAKEIADLRQKAVRDNAPLFDKIDRQFMMTDPDKRRDNYMNRERN